MGKDICGKQKLPKMNVIKLKITPPDKTWSSVMISLVTVVIHDTIGWFHVTPSNRALINIAYVPYTAVRGPCRWLEATASM